MGEHHGVSTPVAHGGDARALMPPPPPPRPKIKIIHIIAPEIIKTDVANFRDLVQRLTGKPACARVPEPDTAVPAPPAQEEATKKRPAPAPAPAAAPEKSDFSVREEPAKKRKIKCEVKVEEEGAFGDYDLADRGDLWMDLNPGGGFLSFLEEEDDDIFLQGMAAPDYDFLQPFGSTRMDLVGEMYAS